MDDLVNELFSFSENLKGSIRTFPHKLIIDLYNKTKSDVKTAEIILFSAHPDLVTDTNVDSLRKKIGFVTKQKSKLRGEKLRTFEKTEFKFPVKSGQSSLSGASQQVIERRFVEKSTQTDPAANKLHVPSSVKKRLNDRSVLVAQLGEENSKLNSKCRKLTKEVKEETQKVSKFREKLFKIRKLKASERRNFCKKVKARDSKISTLNTQNVALKEKHDNLEHQLAAMTNTSNEQIKCRQLQKQISRLKSKIKAFKIDHQIIKESKEELAHKNKQLMKEAKDFQECIDFLEEGKVNNIPTTDARGRYIDSIRRTCMELTCRYNVSVRKASEVIRTVINNITNNTIEDLPTSSTIQRLFLEANAIAKAHVAEKLETNFDPCDDLGNVSHSDATTKHHRHYQGNQATLKTGEQISIGLSEVASGDAEAYTKIFEQTLEDLAEAAISGTEETRKRLIVSFKAMMTDRCSVNGVLAENIQNLRAEAVAEIVPGFLVFSPEKQEQILQMSKHACRMHLLANFALAADKGVAAYETAVCSGDNPYSFRNMDQSGCLRLIRTAAKAFTQRGCDKSGVHHFFQPFLEGKKNHILTYIGHRFNIMFTNAAAVYHHKDDITRFLQNWPQPNQLLQSVLFDINQTVYIAGVRALGIIAKQITEPFAVLLKGKKILEINDDLRIMQQKLQEWSQDGSSAMKQYEPIFHTTDNDQTEVVRSLFAATDSPDLDSYTQLAIEMVTSEMLVLLERQAESQLPGGSMATPEDHIARASANVPAENLVAERDMASLDNLLKLKPSAAISTIEACLMWQTNRPDQWLSTDEHVSTVMEHARTLAARWRRKYMDRREALVKEKMAKLQAKQNEKAQKEANAVEGKLKITKAVEACGGVWDADTVAERISSSVDDRKLKEDLVNQIKFHKVVTGAQGPRHLFQQSKDGEQYDTETLASHLTEILNMNYAPPAPRQETLQYKSDYLEKIHQMKKKIFNTLLEARKRRQNLQQVNTLLPVFIHDPSALPGRSVFHKCVWEGEVEWFRGEVMEISERKKDPLKTQYRIKYDLYPDDVWTFPLLVDLKKGDLVVV